MSSIRDIKDTVEQVVLDKPAFDDNEVADIIIKNLSVSEKTALAHEMLRTWSHLAHRNEQRTVERSSVTPKSRPKVTAATSTSIVTVDNYERTPTMYERVAKSISQYIDEIKIELTDELLEETFARGDGTQVKWGEATIDEHKIRAQRLRKLAAGNAEAAARHELVIRMLDESGSSTLFDLRSMQR